MTSDSHSLGGDWSGQLVTAAVHAGHDLRPEVAEAMILDEAVRLREEDPFTDVIGSAAPARAVAHRSRFEVDLNRPRESAVYRRPEDCWGLRVWRKDCLDEEIVGRSLALYDAFFADLAERLDEVAARGPFVVYDVHSYNSRGHNTDGGETGLAGDPEVNVGTGTVDEVFAPVVDAFRGSLSGQQVGGHRLDVRENVTFEGRALAWWVHGRYPGRGVCLAVEVGKTFMDERTGGAGADHEHVAQLRDALAATHQPVLEALGRLGAS